MKFSIIHIEAYSGKNLQVYTIKYDNKEISELQSFIYKFQDSHPEVIQEAVQRIRALSQRNGIQSSFLNENHLKAIMFIVY